MNKTFTFIFALLLHTALSMNMANAQVQPTFNLTATNFQFTDSLGDGDDAMTFDIMILHTNLAQSGPFEFALGQYYFNFDAASGVTSADYTFYMVPGTTTFTNVLAVPRGPTIVNPDASSHTGGSLRLNSNTVLGSGNGPIISSAYPGTRVSTFKLKKKVGNMPDFTNFMLSGTSGYGTNTASAWRLALNNPFTKIFAYVGTLNTDISLQGTYTFNYASLGNLSLKIIPEGIYFNLFNQLSRRDTVNVYLRNTASPYSKVDSAKAVIDSMNFTGNFIFPNAPSGTYYITAKHLNSIETWSKSGGEPMTQNGTTNYDFTTAAAQAYGSNLKLKGGKYCVYSGDINQDGIIDASDLIRIYNDSYAGLTGRYLVSDLNGDSMVDASDVSAADNNVYIGVLKITP
ncbi:MAG: hypothetical protein JST15_02965 [Bacteroidetes bacterium]|nr:hypothetical protein [Bacteroidota bacterium]